MANLKHTLLCKIVKRMQQKCFGLFVNHVILWNRVLNWWSKSLTKEIIDLQLLGFFRVLASWLLSSVSLNVVPQNMFKTKRLVALGTFVHLFARMADKVRWFLRVAKRPNDLLHWAHLCNFSPLCMMRWLFRWTAWPNDLLHWANLCNFAPLLVVSKCVLRLPAWPNDLLHWAQVCAFSPLCASKCLLRSPASPNDLLHWVHLCDFSPLWETRCLFRVSAKPNDFVHCAHLCTFSPLWVKRCFLVKWYIALCTIVNLLTTVSEKMSLQIISLSKWFFTLSTFVHLFSAVS